MKHKLHQLLWACFKGKTGGGGKIASPTDIHIVPLLRIATLEFDGFFIIIIIIIMWSI